MLLISNNIMTMKNLICVYKKDEYFLIFNFHSNKHYVYLNDLLYLEECITTNRPNKKSIISPVIIVSIIKIPTIIPIVPADLEPFLERIYPENKNTANAIEKKLIFPL